MIGTGTLSPAPAAPCVGTASRTEYLATDTARARSKAIGYQMTGFDAKRTADIIDEDTAAFTELLNAGVMKMQ